MTLDYTSGCVNFRDIGGYVNLIADKKLLPEGLFFRGGTIDYVKNHRDIQYAQTIINLRNSPDPKIFNSDYLHFPMLNKIEKYDTGNPEVKKWLNNIMTVFSNKDIRFPVLIHCLSGKDRTGVVTAALLKILGIDNEIIEQEYLLSDGDINLSYIQISLSGFENIEVYFNNADIHKIQEVIQKKL